MAGPASRTRRDIGVFVAAMVARLVYLVVVRPPFGSVYWALSDSLLRDGSLAVDGTRLTDFEPVYPLFLAVTRLLTGDRMFLVQVAQIAVASAGAVCAGRLAERLGGTRRQAMIAGLLYAGYPLLIRQAAQAAEPALLATLLVGFASAFVGANTPRRSAVAGLALGLVVLTRAMMAPLVVLGAAILTANRRSRAAAAFVLTTLLVVAPLPIRNHAVNGSWWPTRSGLNLFIGNCRYSAALIPIEDVDLLQDYAREVVARERPDLSESAPDFDRQSDALLTRLALAHMAEHPLRTLGQKISNGLYFFSPQLVPLRVITPQTRLVIGPAGQVRVEGSRPRPSSEVMAYTIPYSLVLLCALAGIYRRRRDLRHDAILWSIAATVVAANVLYFPATRYMAPMVFVVLFYAATGIVGATGAAGAGAQGAVWGLFTRKMRTPKVVLRFVERMC